MIGKVEGKQKSQDTIEKENKLLEKLNDFFVMLSLIFFRFAQEQQDQVKLLHNAKEELEKSQFIGDVSQIEEILDACDKSVSKQLELMENLSEFLAVVCFIDPNTLSNAQQEQISSLRQAKINLTNFSLTRSFNEHHFDDLAEDFEQSVKSIILILNEVPNKNHIVPEDEDWKKISEQHKRYWEILCHITDNGNYEPNGLLTKIEEAKKEASNQNESYQKSHLVFTPLKNNKELNTSNETPDINDISDDQNTNPFTLSKKKRNKDSSTSDIKDYNKKDDFSNSHFPATSSNNTVAHTSAKKTNKQINMEKIVEKIIENLSNRRGFFDLPPDAKIKKIRDAYDKLKNNTEGMQLLNNENFETIKATNNKAIQAFLAALKESRSLFHLGKVQSYQEFKYIIESMNGLETIVDQITKRLRDKRAGFFNNSAELKAAKISTAFLNLKKANISEDTIYKALQDIKNIKKDTPIEVKNFINALNESRSLLNLGEVKSFQEFKFKINALNTYKTDAEDTDDSNNVTPTKK